MMQPKGLDQLEKGEGRGEKKLLKRIMSNLILKGPRSTFNLWPYSARNPVAYNVLIRHPAEVKV